MLAGPLVGFLGVGGGFIILPFTAAAVVGSLLGARAARRTSHVTLRRAFAGLHVLVAAYVAVRSTAGPT